MKYTDILPKIAQYEGIPYVKDYQCPSCGRCTIGGDGAKPFLIGWCESPNGFMLVFECPVCFTKFRCHCSTEIFDINSLELTIDDYVCNGVPHIIRNAEDLYNAVEQI